jgi:tRNA(Ile)-lysidine synthase
MAPALKVVRAKFNQALKVGLLAQNARVLIAVSGGQDSLCLAELLRQAQSKWNWQLAIAHCDHNWRTDSAECAIYVRELAKSWQIPFFLRVADNSLNSEAAARTWRYQMLEQIAAEAKCEILVTGHTRSDRAETLLYNLMRGSGSDGLQALGWQRNLSPCLRLVRPLLEVSRQETLDFCHELNLSVWQDSSNHELKYRRNRIRTELIPYMAEHFNPQVEIALAQTAELLCADVTYLEEQAKSFWQTEIPRLNRVELKKQAIALQRRIVRQFLHFHLMYQVDFAEIAKFMELLNAPNRAVSPPFARNVYAKVEHPWIYLIKCDST